MKKFPLLLAIVALFLFMTGYSSLSAFAGKGHDHGHEEPVKNREDAPGPDHGDTHAEGEIHMDAAQAKKAGITVTEVSKASVSTSSSWPGHVTLADDRRALVTPRVPGTVKQVLKNIGDTVSAGDTLAIIESPEIAEVSAEYLAAKRAEELAKTVSTREEKLWREKVTAEQDYLAARNAHMEATIRLNLAAQKMRAAGQDPKNATKGSDYLLTSPIDGRIISRSLTLGAYADTTSAVFDIADTSLLWVEASVPAADLTSIAENQEATITAGGITGTGRVMFISPAIDSMTRKAKVVASLPNPDSQWRAGTFVNLSVPTGAAASGIAIPLSALQSIEGKDVVFVQTNEGFLLRPVKTGLRDGTQVLIDEGLATGERVATGNVFVLKAELGKSEAEHAH